MRCRKIVTRMRRIRAKVAYIDTVAKKINTKISKYFVLENDEKSVVFVSNNESSEEEKNIPRRITVKRGQLISWNNYYWIAFI